MLKAGWLRPEDIWLTGRWRAYTRRFGILFETPVEHEPWPLAAGVVEELTETLVTATGLPLIQQTRTDAPSPAIAPRALSLTQCFHRRSAGGRVK